MDQLVAMLKSRDLFNVRVTVGHRWMVWCWATENWEVYENRRNHRGTSMVLQTELLGEAVNCLSQGESV